MRKILATVVLVLVLVLVGFENPARKFHSRRWVIRCDFQINKTNTPIVFSERLVITVTDEYLRTVAPLHVWTQ